MGVTKPDGSITTMVYDNAQRVVSTVEKTASNVVITGFEYTYDNLSRIVEEKHLANSTKMCYTYDNLSRVTNRTIKNECDCVISSENFTYDAAGNITDAPESCFQYDTNNRLIVFNGNSVSYDMDGNMLNNGVKIFTYDSANRLITADGHTYTYNAEDVRIRNLCTDEDTTYTYNTNCKLSKLLCKTTNGITTKYVYGHGLIGEEKCGNFKTYHFDFRGSTVAITDQYGNITDTFAYDTYGKLISRTGNSFVIFGYNGRDGVITDRNGLIYMRARYYSPEMKRFINADIIPGEISDSTSLNRYSYVNGNPVSFVDPFGLSKERAGISQADYEKFIKTLNELFIFSKKYKGKEFKVDVGVLTYYLNYEMRLGNGPVDIDNLIEGQIELCKSIDFSKGTFKKKTGSEILLGIEYSVDIDDYNSVSASMTIKHDKTTSAEYQITSKYTDGLSISTTMGVETQKPDNPPPPVTVTDKVVEEEKEPSFWEQADEALEGLGDGMVDFAVDHPFLAGVLIIGSILIPGPQFGFI